MLKHPLPASPYSPTLREREKAFSPAAVHDLVEDVALSLEVSAMTFSGVKTAVYNEGLTLSPTAGKELARIKLNVIRDLYSSSH